MWICSSWHCIVLNRVLSKQAFVQWPCSTLTLVLSDYPIICFVRLRGGRTHLLYLNRWREGLCVCVCLFRVNLPIKSVCKWVMSVTKTKRDHYTMYSVYCVIVFECVACFVRLENNEATKKLKNQNPPPSTFSRHKTIKIYST